MTPAPSEPMAVTDISIPRDGIFEGPAGTMTVAPSEPTAEGQVVYPAICLPLVLELATLRADLARMKAAMEWYADKVIKCRMNHSEGDEARRELDRDCGERALAALKGTSP